MPRFSVVVPSYGNAKYLPACLDSLISQDFPDWEVIVVDDCSTDGSLEIARNYCAVDPRIKVLEFASNCGLHLARKAGVKAARGDYLLFLDPDDALMPGSFVALDEAFSTSDCDVVHFGIHVIPEGDTDIEDAKIFGDYLNGPYRDLCNEDILKEAFDPIRHFARDWMVTQRAFSSTLAKSSFDAMTDERLERAEDAYEFFVIAAHSCKEITIEVPVYEYHYGRGVTGYSHLSCQSFSSSAQQFSCCIDAIASFARSSGGQELNTCYLGAREKLMQLLFNDWHDRVSDEDKIIAAEKVAQFMDPTLVAAELARCARDDAYVIWESDASLGDNEPLLNWIEKAKELSGVYAATSDSYIRFYRQAIGHIKDIRDRDRARRYAAQDIRIFVSTHKPVDTFDSDILQPVQVGVSLANYRIPGTLADNDGDNISNLNKMYCELTTQYWAWKNVDAEYYGFCHYRRYFDFNEAERHEENGWGEIIDGYIGDASQKRYALDDQSIRAAVEGFDVITTEFKDIRKYPDMSSTPVDQYRNAALLHFEDLDHVIGILKDLHPDYAEDADSFLSGNYSCFCNMFILRKPIFQAYCEWMFPILERFVSETDMSHYSREALRTPGHLSERLFNIFYLHHMRVHSGWKTKQLQCVHFEHPEAVPVSLSAYIGDTGGRPVVPVAFAADNAYVPMLTTTICSMLKNASDAFFYDIVILHRDISGTNQSIVRSFVEQAGNACIRFYDVSHLVSDYHLSTNNEHIGVETYYRFLIQKILPDYDKVIYLDSDLIVKGDISELYGIDLGTNLLAAAHDIDFMGNLNVHEGKRMGYAKNVLGLDDPYSYFQAGVLVLNTLEMRKSYTIDQWLEFASDTRYIYNDQDVLNAYCKGRVVFLPYEWNVMIDCGGRIGSIFSLAPAKEYDAFLDSRTHEKIVHYAGFEKPWKMSGCDRFELYWEYARCTPYYEKLLALLAGASAPEAHHPIRRGRALPPESGMRKYLDPIMPIGTRRREIAKAIGRAIRGVK